MSDKDSPDSSVLAGGSRAAVERERKSGFSFGKLMRFLRVFPWTLLLIAVAVLLEFLPERFQGTTLDYSMIVFALVVFVIEVIKGADIRISRFIVDLLVAITAVIIATALVTYHVAKTGESPAFYQWVVAAVVVLDALVSTTIAFSTALRNMSVAHDM